MTTIKELNESLLKIAKDHGGDENTQIGVLQSDGDVFPLTQDADNFVFDWDEEIESIVLDPDSL